MSPQLFVSIFVTLLLFTKIEISQQSPVPALCEHGVLEEMPQHIKKVCMALENSNQLSNALNAYIKNEATALMYKPDDDLLQTNAAKRTDVDHVFLRFGKRR